MIIVPLRKSLVTLATVFAILAIVFFANVASAKDEGYGGSARITVYVIEASNGVPGVDPEIREIVEQFEGAFRYSTYKLVSKIPKKVGLGEEEKFSLPGDRELVVLCRGYKHNRIKLNVRIVEKRKDSRELLNTDFGIVDGGTMIIGGYPHRDGKLMLAISADM
ncbi:hypothetical protein HZA56_00385 [Candidatus Poribacteria bacterium]|nr:hypothetical protein [Candidatus Poribacteria bacterium]